LTIDARCGAPAAADLNCHRGRRTARNASRSGPPGDWQRHRRLAGCSSAYRKGWEATMSVARVTEIISASDQSFEHAVREGVERANQTLENIKEAWVASQKVVVENGKIIEYRVTLKVTFVLR
jgi:flavin-binding protein dodecin